MGNVHCQIWMLDENLTLEQIQNIQAQNYNEQIPYLMNNQDIPAEDKILTHHWCVVPDIQQMILANDVTIQYYLAQGFFEKTFGETKAFVDSEHRQLLPRDRRVFSNIANTIFLEYRERLYVIVYGVGQSVFNVKGILMGAGRGNHRRPDWGHINTTVEHYKLNSDFFYWLFDKEDKEQPIQSLYGEILINDVEGIGRYTERHQHDIRGTGADSISEISNKSALSVNQYIYTSDLTVRTPKIATVFSMDEFAHLCVDDCRSMTIDNAGHVNSIDNMDKYLLNIYFELIPGLVAAYNADQSNGIWNSRQAGIAHKHWALDVIRELVRFHNISQNEIFE